MVDTEVSVLGCGRMGGAMAQTWAANGHRVAAWNRTASKAQALAATRITPVEFVVDAVAAAPVVLMAVASYRDCIALLESAANWSDKIVVNIATGLPEQAAELSSMVTRAGGVYLDAVAFGRPLDIELGRCALFVAGDPTGWSRVEQLLHEVGRGSRFLSKRVTTAKVMEIAFGAYAMPANAAMVESADFALRAGVSGDDFVAVCELAAAMVVDTAREVVAAAQSGDLTTTQGNIAVRAKATAAFLALMRAEGIPADILAAADKKFSRAISRGDGELGLFALAERGTG